MSPPHHRQPTLPDVTAIWWPLAASWLFMSMELPMVGAALARWHSPEIQLAAFGGVVYPLMLLIESPVIMLLAASTALSRDWPSYADLRRYMNRMSVGLTLLHLAVALTPLYYLVVGRVIQAPPEIIEPARIGVILSVPWTWAIAYRRFNQGILIRHGASRAIGVGTVLRLATTLAVLATGMALQDRLPIPGVGLGAFAIIAGVLAEAAYVRARTAPVLAEFFDPTETGEGLRPAAFLRFYVPLALTSLLSLVLQPIGSAAVSRMPRPLESLAAWPIVIGLVFLLRSGATAYKEVVVAVLDRPRPIAALRRFNLLLGGGILTLSILFSLTPLADVLLRYVSGLRPDLAALAGMALALGVAIPGMGVGQNWSVGYLVNARRTRHITESMIAYLVVACGVLALGVIWQRMDGLYTAMVAFSLANVVQLAWVWWFARGGLREMAAAES